MESVFVRVALVLALSLSMTGLIQAPPAGAVTGPTTVAAGDLTTDATWTPEGSPYLLKGRLRILEGATLTILPGTVVKLLPMPESTFNGSWLLVYGGRLVANGTGSEPITITSGDDNSVGGATGNGNPQRGDWYSVSFSAPSRDVAQRMPESIVNNVRFKYGGVGSGYKCVGYAELQVMNLGRVHVSRSEFTESQYAGVWVYPGTAEGVGSAIVETSKFSNSGCGVVAESGQVLGNIVEDTIETYAGFLNGATGVRVYGNWFHKEVYVYAPPGTRAEADLRENALLGGVHDQPADQDHKDLSLNWWGHPLDPQPSGCHNPQTTYIPAVTKEQAAEPTVECPYLINGYFTKVLPAMDSPPPVPDAGIGGGLYPGLVGDGKPDGPCPEGQTTGDSGCGNLQGDPVNSFTGAFVTADQDFSMPVRGGELSAWRSYDSRSTQDGAMGPGWTYAYSDALAVEPGVKVTWRTSQGGSVVFAFDSGTTWKAPFGHSARLTEDSDGSFTIVTEDSWALSFTSAGVFTKATDRNGRQMTISRDGQGRVATVTASGRSLKYVYDTSGKLKTITAKGSAGLVTAVTTYTYAGGLLASVTKADSSKTLFGYTGGRLSSIRTNATSAPQMQLTYQGDGRVATQTDGEGNVTTFDWDSATSTSTMTDARGGQWKDVYSDGWLVKQVDPTGLETTYSYTDAGKLSQVVAPGGQKNTFRWDAAGRLTARTDALGRTASLAYTDAYREPDSVTDVAARKTTFDYDGNRNLTIRTPPVASARTTTGYTSGTFDVASFTDPTQQTTTFGHDLVTGDLESVTSPMGEKSTFTTDVFGRVMSTTPPPGNVAGASGTWATTYTRDRLGRVTTVKTPRGVEATYTYDAFGRVATEKDGRGNLTKYAYDNAGRITTITKADGSTESFTYDANGNVATAKDGRGQVRTMGYDAANRLTSLEAEGRTWEYTYDGAGRRKTTEAPSGRAVTVNYDARSLPTQLDYSDSTPDVTITYDALGRRQSVADGTGTWEYDYDDLDRPTNISHGSDEWNYTWDAAGRLASREAPGQQPTSFDYDADGRLTKVSRGETDVASYVYDTAANTVTRTQANGITSTETYGRGGELVSVVEKNANGTLTRSAKYTRDLFGNPTKEVDKDGKSTLASFDSRNRLTQICYDTSLLCQPAKSIKYSYDANNNITAEARPTGTVSRNYDDHDQLTEETEGTQTRTFEYDADGNRTQADDTTYTVNAAGQVTSSTVGGTTTEYTYNAAGLLATKAVGTSTTKYDYDPISAQLVGQRDGSTVTHQFAYGSELVAMTAGGDTDYYTTDELGSVIATRNSSGALQKSYTYEPYGAEVSQAGSGTVSPLQYTGGLSLDAKTYRFGLRHYDPTSATFTTPDPAETGETYSYAGGNPAVYIDPLGLAPIYPGGVPNFDSLLGGGPSRAWDAFNNSSVARYAIRGFLYVSGAGSSRAFKDHPFGYSAIAVGSIIFPGVRVGIGGRLIAPFSTQRAVTAGQRGAIQAHHLVERRFARQMGGNTDDWITIVVTRSEHQVFTNAWRQAIPYGAGTRTASRAQIEAAARRIYADYPEILRALGLG